MSSKNRSSRLVTGFLAGALVGAATGLLLAPQPGRKTRHGLKHKTGHYVGTLRERLKTTSLTNGAAEQEDAVA